MDMCGMVSDSRAQSRRLKTVNGELRHVHKTDGWWTGLVKAQRFRKAFSPPYSSLLRLIQAKSSQELEEKRTLAGVGWNELE
jgi:hypothetical protein